VLQKRQNYCDTCLIEQLQQREKQFVQKQQQFSWLSWNYADAYTRKYFQKKGLITDIQ
jgi:hypothetical protein